MNHHYVPQWYQRLFLDDQQKYHYMDMKDNQLYYRPVKYCFAEENLYRIEFFNYTSNIFEEVFFGKIDKDGKNSIATLTDNSWEETNPQKTYSNLINYLGAQYFRTPKGLAKLKLSMYLGNNILTPKAIQNELLQRIEVLIGTLIPA